MSKTRKLSANQIHRRLQKTLKALQRAETSAVLLFSEILERKLYRDLGYSSIQQYAALALGFSTSKTAQFLRLCGAFEQLPALKRSIASGDVSWTKAREILSVATEETQNRWIEEARNSSRRRLVEKVAETKMKARAERKRNPTQARLLPAIAGEDRGENQPSMTTDNAQNRGSEDIPVGLSFRLAPREYTRYEALMAKLRKLGAKGSREEILLMALEALAVDEIPVRTTSKTNTRVHRTPLYQVVVQHCEACQRSAVATSAGERLLTPAALGAVLCDSRLHRAGKKNRASIRPSTRAAVLARDRFTCKTAGCGRAQFLEVHHLTPRSAGGANCADNLITLCSGCHEIVHRHKHLGEVFARAT